MTDQITRIRTIIDGAQAVAQIYNLNLPGDIIFPTSTDSEMQCGFGEVSTNKIVCPHVHKRLRREIHSTSEFIFVINGNIDIVFYGENGRRLCEERLTDGMAFIQFFGGHGMEIASGTKYVEVKQGPYYGNHMDKTLLSEL